MFIVDGLRSVTTCLIRSYIGQCRWYRRTRRQTFSLREAILDFPKWLSSFDSAAITDGQPWLTFGAIAFLRTTVNTTMRICEFGVGGSTVFYVQRGGMVVSIEHDPAWATVLVSHIGESHNWILEIVPPEVDSHKSDYSPSQYKSSRGGASDLSFHRYAKAIDGYSTGFFDIIQIDGRVRVSCIARSINKVARCGYLILDDSERDDYKIAHAQLDSLGWRRLDFCGPAPYTHAFKCTTIWQRPA